SALSTSSASSGWSRSDNFAGLNTGGRYNPIADSWTATSTTDAAYPRAYHTTVWTGTEMIVWGGRELLDAQTPAAGTILSPIVGALWQHRWVFITADTSTPQCGPAVT